MSSACPLWEGSWAYCPGSHHTHMPSLGQGTGGHTFLLPVRLSIPPYKMGASFLATDRTPRMLMLPTSLCPWGMPSSFFFFHSEAGG